MGAGDYPHLFSWRARLASTTGSTGEVVESWPSVTGTIWGRVSEDVGFRRTMYGAEASGADATIELQNRPAVQAGDRLTYFGRTYRIDSIKRLEPDGMICDGYVLDINVTGD